MMVIPLLSNSRPSLCSLYGRRVPDLVIESGTLSSSLNVTNFANMKILFLGSFIIDTDLTFTNCILEYRNGNTDFAPTASNLELNIIECKLYSCSGRWTIQTYNSPNNHSVKILKSDFENFTTAFRLRNTLFGCNSSNFYGGVDYTHGTIDLHACYNDIENSIYNNIFYQVAGGIAIHSEERSKLIIRYNHFFDGLYGIQSRQSELLLTDNEFNLVNTGISSEGSTITVNRFFMTDLLNFNNCNYGIVSKRDLIMDVTDQIFKSGVDVDIRNTNFARFTENEFGDPTLTFLLKINILSRATNILLNNNHFFNNKESALGVDVNGGNCRAVGNEQIRSINIPYYAYNVVNTPVQFQNNTMFEGSVLFSAVVNGSYIQNTSNNILLRDAWKSQISPAGLYCDNSITSPYSKGLFFDGNNMNTTLATTSFGNCATGLAINDVIGSQVRRGNKWIGAYSNFGASYTGQNSNLPLSRFTALNLLPWTPSHNPADLFQFTSNTMINGCNRGLIGDGNELTDTDINILSDNDTWSKDISAWIARWYLYYKLYTHPILLNNSQAADWYNTMTGTDVEAIALINYHLYQANQYANESAILHIIDEINQLDESSPTSMLHNLWNQLAQEMNIANLVRNQHLEQAVAFTNSLIPNTLYDELFQDVHRIYLHTLMDSEYELSIPEQSRIDEVSSLCPENFGPAVHVARHFVANDGLLALYNISCDQAVDLRSNLSNSSISDCAISPNPSNGLIHISGTYAKEVFIYNNIGVLVKKPDLKHNQVDLSDMKNGIYFMKIGTQINKIIISK